MIRLSFPAVRESSSRRSYSRHNSSASNFFDRSLNLLTIPDGPEFMCPLGRKMMAKNLRFATTCLAGVLVAVAMTPSLADEQFAATGVVQLPDGQILSAFDIGFVDPKSHTLAVAASRGRRQRGAFGTVVITSHESHRCRRGELWFVLAIRRRLYGSSGQKHFLRADTSVIAESRRGEIPMSGRETARFSTLLASRPAVSRPRAPSRCLTCTTGATKAV